MTDVAILFDLLLFVRSKLLNHRPRLDTDSKLRYLARAVRYSSLEMIHLIFSIGPSVMIDVPVQDDLITKPEWKPHDEVMK